MSELKDPNKPEGTYMAILENMRELLGAIYIQEMRNYDMLSIIADKLGADAKGLSQLHTQGEVLAPPASFIFEEEQSAEADLQDSLLQEDMTNDN
jgi:hypothetical protein